MNWWINTGSKLRYEILAFVMSMGQSKSKCESTTGFKTMASHISPSETQGQLVGTIECTVNFCGEHSIVLNIL